MKPSFAIAVCRVLTALACCLGVLTAPVAVGLDCGGARGAEKCECCEDPQAGCCSANHQGVEMPVPVLPVNAKNLRDVAPMPLTVVAVLPPFVACEFPKFSDAASVRAPHVARHSLLCIRTV